MGERIHRLFDPDEKHHQPAPPCEDVPRKTPQEALAREGCRSRLFLSLLSGLPNEQDFVLAALAHQHKGPPLSPRLLEVLVAQAGVWDTGAALGGLYSECWRGVEGRCTRLFWRATLPSPLCATLGVDSAAGEEEEPFLEPWELRAEGRRVTQVALILHNLSFEVQNVSVLVNSAIFIRFLLLCIHCSWANLKQIAFDTLANIAEEVQLCGGEEADRLLLGVVLRGVVSGDRFVALRSMDALAQMALRNELLIAPQIDTQVCGRLVSLLSVRDVLLLHLALECLCALSELGRAPCDCIARTPGVAGALVSLLTLDPELQYGLGGMQVVEEQPPRTAQVKRVVPPASPPPISKEVNSETFASNWLRGQYEGCAGACVEDVYAAYVGFCARAQRKGVLGAHAFAATLKSCFPQVEVQQNSFLGLRKKGAQTAVQSPLLQAQLSAPPEARLKVPRPPPLVVVAPGQQQQVRCVVPQVRKIAPQLNGRLQASSQTTSEPILRPVQKIQLSPEEPSRANVKSEAAEPSFILSGIQGNQVTYRLAGPADLALTNRLFVRSNGVAPKKEDVRGRSPLLNGLLDKKVPKRDILFHALVQNGIQAEPAGGEGVVRMTAAAQEGGVVRLHIESPENSNGPNDLSSLSDIAHTLECASEAIARTHDEDANSCLPDTSVPLAKNVIVQNRGVALPTNSVSSNVVRNVVVNAGTSIIRTLDTNSVVSDISGQSIGTVAMNSVAGNFVRTLAVNSGPGQGVGTLAINSISNNNVRTLSVNSMAGSVIRTLALNSVAGNIISQRSENVAINSVAGNVLGQSVGTVMVNSVAGNVLSPASLALNSVSGNVVRTLSMSSIAGQDVGTLSLNSVTGNVIKTVAVNSGVGNVNSIAGGRPGQQIFVVSSPGSGNPNIKFCILHTLPNSTEDQAHSAGVVLGPQETPPKRPPTEPPLSVVAKKPRTEAAVKTEEVPSAVETTAQTTSTKLEFICEWKNCRMRFSRPGQVLVHARSAHCLAEEGPCAWEGCPAGGRRRRLSLLTHLQDWHCSEGVLKQAAERRRGGGQLPPLPQPPPHPGYAPDAALVAIRRQHPKEPLVEEEESAVAKSVRLTAALVLRNLVTHSERARTCARRFEPELASAAMSSGEASKALAQCLAHLR